MPALLSALLALIALALLLTGLAMQLSGGTDISRRLEQVAVPRRAKTLEELELQQPFSERVLKPLIRSISQPIARIAEKRQQAHQQRGTGFAAIQRRLNLAGNPHDWTPADWLGVKGFVALALAAITFLVLFVSGRPTLALPLAASTGALGFFLPELWLNSRIAARQKEIVRSLPDAIDLLVISVEAGLGFDAALARLVAKSDNALSREFARALAELRLGRPRREALRDIVNRTDVPDLANFISAIIQAEHLGVSVSKVLTVQAEQMRVIRRQRAEELANQAPVKMLLPMVIFIFPALCLIILGPMWPTIANTPGGTAI